MSNNELNKDPYVEEEVLPPPTSKEKPISKGEQRVANLKQTFGQGPGLIALIAAGVIIVAFVGFALYGINKTGQSAQKIEGESKVDQPRIPNRPDNPKVTPEELKRQQQAAAAEAEKAAREGSSYQPGFVTNVGETGPVAGSYNAQFNINGGANDVPVTNAASAVGNAQAGQNEVAKAEAEAEKKRLEEERKAAEAEQQKLNNLYQEELKRRNQQVEQDRGMVLSQIESLQNSMTGKNGTAAYSTTVSYLPPVKAQTNVNGNAVGSQQASAVAASSVGTSIGSASCNPVFRTGNTAYAVLDHEVNTDAGTDAIATVTGGPYNGSKIIGSVTLGNGGLAMKFNRLAPQDGRDSLSIDAVAIPPSGASAGMATSVNRHTIGRYSSLIFSQALSGWGQAAAQQRGSTTQLSSGATVVTTQEANDRQIAGSIAGKVGDAMSAEIGQGFNRPPTYKVARGAGIALFFMNDVCAR